MKVVACQLKIGNTSYAGIKGADNQQSRTPPLHGLLVCALIITLQTTITLLIDRFLFEAGIWEIVHYFSINVLKLMFSRQRKHFAISPPHLLLTPTLWPKSNCFCVTIWTTKYFNCLLSLYPDINLPLLHIIVQTQFKIKNDSFHVITYAKGRWKHILTLHLWNTGANTISPAFT